MLCLAYNSPCDTILTFPASLIRCPASSNCILRSPPRELTYLALITPRQPPCRRPKLYIQRVCGAAHEILREPSNRRIYSRFERYIGDRRWHHDDMHIERTVPLAQVNQHHDAQLKADLPAPLCVTRCPSDRASLPQRAHTCPDGPFRARCTSHVCPSRAPRVAIRPSHPRAARHLLRPKSTSAQPSPDAQLGKFPVRASNRIAVGPWASFALRNTAATAASVPFPQSVPRAAGRTTVCRIFLSHPTGRSRWSRTA